MFKHNFLIPISIEILGLNKMRTKNEINNLLEKIKGVKRESKYVDFKENFDVDSQRDWCEIIKDIVAMTNSGGGVILIGIKNDGTPSEFDIKKIFKIDPAQMTDKIAKYTLEQFSDFEIREVTKNKHKIAMLLIEGKSSPMIFVRPGTYNFGDGQQNTAFSRGTIYFRHGAKSEPGDSNDIKKVIDREVERSRKFWLGNIRKVVKAPSGHIVHVLPPEVRVSTISTATPIRIVDEPRAPPYRLETPDITHPHRQKEVIQIFNQKLQGKKSINTYDMFCVRRVYDIDRKKPQHCYESKYASPQYSENFVKWLIGQFNKDSSFFEKAREKYNNLKN